MRAFLFISLIAFILLMSVHYRINLESVEKITELIEAGNEYFQNRQYSEAVNAYSNALHLKDDKNVRTRLNLATRYLGHLKQL